MTSVRIHVDGDALDVPAGITVAAALVSAGRWHFRRNPVSGQARGPFCGMGVCFECELAIDGRPAVRACMEHVYPGMRVATGIDASGSGDG